MSQSSNNPSKPKKKKTLRRRISYIFWNLVFIAGMLICAYPIYGGMFHSYQQNQAVGNYQSKVNETTQQLLDNLIANAKKYNEELYKSQQEQSYDMTTLSDDNYKSMLSLNGAETMGTIEIPSISVNLPIYHGTSDEVLNFGVGHLQSSSLPVGGKNTRSILTGHRGLPSSKLFTRLDELKKGDMIYISVCGKNLAYKVRDIKTIEPTDLDSLKTEEGEDLISLITCTPYGINTHRLVVTAERTKYDKKEKEEIKANIPSLREIFLVSLPVFILGYTVGEGIYKHHKKKAKAEKEKQN